MHLPLLSKSRYAGPFDRAVALAAVSPLGRTLLFAGALLVAGCERNQETAPTSPVSADVTASATPAKVTINWGNNQVGAVGQPLLKRLIVKVTDAGGAPVRGVTVTFAVTSGNGSVSVTSATTNSYGKASSRLTLGPAAGTNTVQATVHGLTPVTFTATGRVPTTLSIVSGNNQSGTAGAALPSPLVVQVTDSAGSVVPAATVTFSVTAGGGSVSPVSAKTTTTGEASTTWTLGSTAGTDTVTASAGGLRPVTFTTQGGGTSPRNFALSCGAGSVTVPQASASTMTCTITSRDGFSGPVALSSGSLPIGVTLSPFASTVTPPANGSTNVAIGLNVDASVVPGSYSFQVVGTSGSATSTFTGQLTVSQNTARVRVIYLVPSDRSEQVAATRGMERAIRHLQIWYRNAMGSGKTFTIAYPVVRVVRTSHPASWYATNPRGGDQSGWFWNNTLYDAFALTGGRFYDPDDIWLYYIDADPASGQMIGATSGVAVLAGSDVRGVAGQSSAGTCRWFGGLGHEAGHAFGLPHPPDQQSNALMWTGMYSYPNAVLTAADKNTLNRSAFFSNISMTSTLFDCSSPPGASVVATR